MKSGILEKKNLVNTETNPSPLYLEAIQARPSAVDKGVLLTELTNQLESLAKKAGLSVKDFLVQAESSLEFKEDYLEALTMARQIARLKNTP